MIFLNRKIVNIVDLLMMVEEYALDLENIVKSYFYCKLGTIKHREDLKYNYFREYVQRDILKSCFNNKNINSNFFKRYIIYFAFNKYEAGILKRNKLKEFILKRYNNEYFDEDGGITEDDVDKILANFYKDLDTILELTFKIDIPKLNKFIEQL